MLPYTKEQQAVLVTDRSVCRVCGLQYVIGLPEDEEIHKTKHKELLRGGLPLKVREFLKSYGWAVAHNDGGLERLNDQWDEEVGKCAVVFSWWARAKTKGISEKDFEAFMYDHFKFVDARIIGDAERTRIAHEGIKKWERYA